MHGGVAFGPFVVDPVKRRLWREGRLVPITSKTFDLLALMWQFYFQPPQGDVQTFALATTKRIYKVTATRKGVETIEWANGPVETELWHRTSEDGRTEGYVWLAPSLRWLPVKVRAETPRGTVEVLLDSIRVDDALRVSEAATR